MKRTCIGALCASFACMAVPFAANAVSTSGSVSGTGSKTINFTCDGAPTCTGTYTASYVDAECGPMAQFSGPATLTGFDPSQPSSSGTFTLSNFRVYNATCSGVDIITTSGSYTASSNGSSGSMTVTVQPAGGPAATLSGSFVVGGGSSPVRVSGSYGLADATGHLFGQFTCTGMPTCTGSVAFNELDEGCSNTFNWTANIVFSSFDLTHTGSFSGTATVYGDTTSNVTSPNTCTYGMRDTNAHNYPYSGSWDGTNGTLTVTYIDSQSGKSFNLPGTFSASGSGVAVNASPVFPITVQSSITPATANATAQITPRPQDVGTTQSVFVFAHAPSSVVKELVKREPSGGAVPSKPADSVICVLAQLGPDGQLHAISASTMQAYLTGVLTSQSQAVNVLNNVATPNVAGATMFVGYGNNAADMLAKGLYQDAVSVPGPVQCTASLASAPAPNSPGPLSGLWWNPTESGWGISFTQRRNILFAAWYTYDASGNPKWYVASNCAMPSGSTGASGTCTGDLYAVDGPTFFGTTFNPSAVHVATAGTLQATFQDANNGSMTYTVAGQTRTVPITRQVFRSGTSPAVDYTDLWYNASESGWGMAITHQSDTMFLAWFVYDGTGKPFWYVAPACTVNGSSCSGSLYRTTGPAFGPTFNPAQVQAVNVGSAIVSFIDANNAVLSYTVDGVSATKTITRQAF